jgi:hypothetical protein
MINEKDHWFFDRTGIASGGFHGGMQFFGIRSLGSGGDCGSNLNPNNYQNTNDHADAPNGSIAG